MITTIRLYGQLGKQFGREWHLDVESPAEAVRALAALRPGFLNAVERLNAHVQGYRVRVGKRDIGEELLEFPNSGRQIAFTPILHGADTKGIVQIVAGVAILAVGVALTVATVGAAGPTLLFGVQLIGLGAAVALGGVARLLMSTPSTTSADQTKQRASYLFSGVVNVVGEGECVPVAFGRVLIGSSVVSAGVEAVDVVAESSTTTRDDPGGRHRGPGAVSPIFVRGQRTLRSGPPRNQQ